MTHRAAAAAALLLTVAGCDRKSDAASATPPAASGADRGGGGGARSGRGGNGGATITLAPGDVAIIHRDTIEESTPISGDLRPIETVDVRARLEGDLVGVFAREGQHVAANQLLAQFESSEQESAQRSAEADRVSAVAELANAQWNMEQSAGLLKAGAISERDHRAAQQAVATATARLAAAESRVKATASMVRDTRVLSPTTGIIAVRSAENGEHVGRGSSLFSIVRNDVLELTASVPSRLSNGMRVGQAAYFIADGRSFSGRVARISPTIDPSSRSGTVYIEIPNGSGAIKSGTFATGRVVNRTLPNVVTVPVPAIRQSQTNDRSFVYTIAGNVLDITQVDLGVVDQRRGIAEVISGVAAGDRVVVGNVGTLGRGMQVTVIGDEGRGGGAAPNGRSSGGRAAGAPGSGRGGTKGRGK